MSRRAIHWIVVCFTLTWFGVLVPVHNRGQIAPFGTGVGTCTDQVAAHHACCPTQRHRGDGATPAEAGGPAEPDKPCAVCYFIAALDTPPPPTFISTRFILAGSSPVAPYAAPVAARPSLSLHSRAPPIA
jgi:hypothetical protein